MSRKLRRGSVEMTYVAVTLRCAKCRANFGDVVRLAGQHPRAGRVLLEQGVGELRERPDGGRTLHSRCRCGATPQTRWERIIVELDQLTADGVSLSVLDV